MKRITLAITGASGAIYAVRTLRALLLCGVTVDVIVSEFGWLLLRDECGFDGKKNALGDFLREQFGIEVGTGELVLHQAGNLGATVASGSAKSDGMVVVPCSMKTLSGIAHGSSRNLIERAADVTLKERRKLVLVPRETPMSLIHLRNMVTATEAGAIMVPAMPAYYQEPKTFDDLADFIAGRILDLLGIKQDLFTRWEGL